MTRLSNTTLLVNDPFKGGIDISEKDEPKKSVTDLYKELEAEGLKRNVGRGEKAEKVRGLVRDIAKQIKQDKLLLSATWKVTKDMIAAKDPEAKLDRAYFTQVVDKAWETEKDQTGHLWIRMDKPVEKKPGTIAK